MSKWMVTTNFIGCSIYQVTEESMNKRLTTLGTESISTKSSTAKKKHKRLQIS